MAAPAVEQFILPGRYRGSGGGCLLPIGKMAEVVVCEIVFGRIVCVVGETGRGVTHLAWPAISDTVGVIRMIPVVMHPGGAAGFGNTGLHDGVGLAGSTICCAR